MKYADVLPEREEAAVETVRQLLPIGIARCGGVISYVALPGGVERGAPLRRSTRLSVSLTAPRPTAPWIKAPCLRLLLRDQSLTR